MQSVFSARPAWVEINLDHIAHNVKQFIELVGPETGIMAVVKADGYGHGALTVAETALQAGATRLAVSFSEEGIELRQAGIEAPILIFGYTDPAQFPALIQYRLTPTVFDLDTALEFSRMAVENGAIMPLQLKVDTGMGRIGLLPEEVIEAASRINRLPGLQIEGLYTHLAAAEEEDQLYTKEQLLLFDRIIDRCREKGITFPQVHAANSAGAIYFPGARYNIIRLGISLYGCYPAPPLENSPVRLLPALALKSKVVMVKELPPGSAISYGCTYRTDKESMIATISIGYADGYSRFLSNLGQVLIRGLRAPIVGRVCMDSLMVDVSAIPGVRRGDEAVLYGRQGAEQITVEESAGLVGSVNYELLCAIDKRVPRFYFSAGKLVSIHDFTEDRVIR